MKFSTVKYLEDMKTSLLKSPRLKMELNRKAMSEIPSEAGVYALFEKKELVYVGETGSIKKRFIDMLNTRKHTMRRRIGEIKFSKIRGYAKASLKVKFPDHIEKLVNNYLEQNITKSFLIVDLGRKELEELIIGEEKSYPIYNSKGKRY